MMAKSYLYALVLGFSMVFNATAAFAVVEEGDPFDGVECLGGGEQNFCVQEITGRYQVQNMDLAPVFAFGVTNTAVSPTSVGRPGWDSFSMSSTDWDDGYLILINGNDFITNELGSFANLFGTDAAVNFYYIPEEDSGAEFVQADLDSRFFYGLDAASQATAFGANSNVLFTTVAAVPEPETYAMLLAGLGLLGWAKRRQHS